MTTGEDWKEFGNGVVFPNDFVESENWVQYILEKPIIEEPATKMNYNSGSSHLLSYIIQEATGMSTERFAKKYLFDPLKINEYEWQQDPQGIYVGGFGMKMKSTDLLKLGKLCLQNGYWNEKEIVSAKWLKSQVGRNLKHMNMSAHMDITGGYYITKDFTYRIVYISLWDTADNTSLSFLN